MLFRSLYPGLIMASSLAGIPVTGIIALLWPGPLVAITLGWLAYFLGARHRLAWQPGRGPCCLRLAPTMLLYTAADTVADPDDCEKAVGAIPSMAESHRYEGGEHNLLLGPDRLNAIERIMAFLAARP